MGLNVGVFTAAVLCLLPLLVRGSDMEEFTHHLQLAYRCSCGSPQPRAVMAATLLGQNKSTSELAFPLCTLLHRCEDSGCCFNHGHSCQPAAVELVSRVFKVSDPLRSTTRFITVYAENHTSCVCLPQLLGEL